MTKGSRPRLINDGIGKEGDDDGMEGWKYGVKGGPDESGDEPVGKEMLECLDPCVKVLSL
jgi:hypothetical protein